ncbi:hypothetical protein Clacol_008324 [Clathrus columnatus]|uniref:Uncharacterized protein n=1 Tax=Clathrus columnatus TaxID=1419009 RepID=A0AAV5AK67_9AGAM|nr:hypothetical protein Clacol_008324 [Clathrus columnatus]
MNNSLDTHSFNFLATTLCDPDISIDEIATKILTTSVQYAQSAAKNDRTTLGDTPGIESFYWSLWKPLVDLAEENETIHERIIALLLALKSSNVGSDWKLFSKHGGWRELPVLRVAICDYWNVLDLPYDVTEEPALSVLEGDAPSTNSELAHIAKARTEYLNMHHFLSRLWKETGIDFSDYGLTIMEHIVKTCAGGGRQWEGHLADMSTGAEDSMEMDFTTDTDRLVHVDSEDEENDEDEDFAPADENEDDNEEENMNHPTLNLAVEAASIWINCCAEELYQILYQRSGFSNAVPVNWLAWKNAFKNVANNSEGRARIMTIAKSVVDKMENIERYRLDGLYVEPISV